MTKPLAKNQTNSGAKNLLANPYLHFVLIGAVLILAQVLARNGILITNSTVTLLGGVIIYAMACLGLDLLLGYGGMISLGTAGFMGLASYVSAYITVNLHLPFELGILAAIAVSVCLGLLVGLASLRIEGIYLAMATMIVAEILKKVFEEAEWFTGSYTGTKAAYPTLLGFHLDRTSTFIMIVVVLVLMMTLAHLVVTSRPGRALHAMRGSEVAAQAMGINILLYRLFAFSLATGFAAVAGVMYVHYFRFSFPSTWVLALSLSVLSAVIIGGPRSVYGSLIGAFIVFAFPDLVLKKLPVIGQINGIALVFNGLLIVLVVLFYPSGLVRVFSDIKLLLVRHRNRGGAQCN
ncbi:MAG: branched-chain amino acid ABC transporter permease [Spirochaetaceae bacterium]|nr:branched-chain amino acid ABC transporter permease [Spirochaetaceae bacterium]